MRDAIIGLEVEKEKVINEIKMLKEDLENEKDNVKNLKIERAEMQSQLEKYRK